MEWRGKFTTIIAFGDTLEGYELELAADFRSFFNISIFDVGKAITYTEAILLCGALVRDPTSRFNAKKSEMDFPVTREYVLLMNLYDAFIQANSDPKKPKAKPYPRPWKNPKIKKFGKASIPLSRAKEFFSKLGYRTGDDK